MLADRLGWLVEDLLERISEDELKERVAHIRLETDEAQRRTQKQKQKDRKNRNNVAGRKRARRGRRRGR